MDGALMAVLELRELETYPGLSASGSGGHGRSQNYAANCKRANSA
jgi:hypothetical protein